MSHKQVHMDGYRPRVRLRIKCRKLSQPVISKVEVTVLVELAKTLGYAFTTILLPPRTSSKLR